MKSFIVSLELLYFQFKSRDYFYKRDLILYAKLNFRFRFISRYYFNKRDLILYVKLNFRFRWRYDDRYFISVMLKMYELRVRGR